MSDKVRDLFNQQCERSIKQGPRVKGYADEFFSALSRWHFGTHGHMNLNRPKPQSGPEGFKKRAQLLEGSE